MNLQYVLYFQTLSLLGFIKQTSLKFSLEDLSHLSSRKEINLYSELNTKIPFSEIFFLIEFLTKHCFGLQYTFIYFSLFYLRMLWIKKLKIESVIAYYTVLIMKNVGYSLSLMSTSIAKWQILLLPNIMFKLTLVNLPK